MTDTSINTANISLLRALTLVLGPGFIAVLFAVGVNMEQSLEVIFNSYQRFLAIEDGFWPRTMNILSVVPRVLLLAAVPGAVFASSRWIYRSVGMSAHRIDIVLWPVIFGTIAWGGYIVALVRGLDFRPVCAFVAENSLIENFLELWNGECGTRTWLFLLTSATFTVFLRMYMIIDDRQQERLDARTGQKWVIPSLVGLAAVLFFLSAGMRPDLFVDLGPLGISGGMFAIFAYALAALTVWSGRYSPLGLPLPLYVLILIILWSSPTAAFAPAVIVLLIGIAAFVAQGFVKVRQSFGKPDYENIVVRLLLFLPRIVRDLWRLFRGSASAARQFLGRFVTYKLTQIEKGLIAVAALSLSVTVVHGLVLTCQSLSGCNITKAQAAWGGKIERAPLPIDAYEVWVKRLRGSEGRLATDVQNVEVLDAPEPITVVAAQGGGLYAAYHAAFYLAAVADEDPEEAKRLFAVSGISGGSVGAGVFWAIRQSGLCSLGPFGQSDGSIVENRCHRDAVDEILGGDFLTPVLTAFYTRDLLDSVAPITLLTRHPMDRGAVMESELNRRTDDWVEGHCAAYSEDKDAQRLHPEKARVCTPANMKKRLGLLRMPITQSWTGPVPVGENTPLDPEPGTPLLLLSAVDVQRGALVTNSALRWINPSRCHRGYIRHAAESDEPSDMRLNTAMVASARYPFVTPPLRINETRQLEDDELRPNDLGSESLNPNLPPNVSLECEATLSRAPVPLENPTELTVVDLLPGLSTDPGKPHVQLADGGFFDSSGIEALWDLVDGLDGLHSYDKAIDIRVVVLTVEAAQSLDRSPKGTIGSPVSAFLGSWRERQVLALQRFSDRTKQAVSDLNRAGVDIEICTVPIKVTDGEGLEANFTLSSFLSKETRDFIRDKIETADARTPQGRKCEDASNTVPPRETGNEKK